MSTGQLCQHGFPLHEVAHCNGCQEMRRPMQAGPLMVRHKIDGHDVLLPADAVLAPRIVDAKRRQET